MIPGSADAVARINFKRLEMLCDNKPGCYCQGDLNEEIFEQITDKMHRELKKSGAHIDGQFFVPIILTGKTAGGRQIRDHVYAGNREHGCLNRLCLNMVLFRKKLCLSATRLLISRSSRMGNILHWRSHRLCRTGR
ncbi:MAG: hypothetical protein Ct9H300mP28_18890 [Pseudomonadota bacterium]|nr:MAG: hypothetical protein Ct9H300mP28_18890 [Pseudomonadota bacterium]